MRLFALAVLLVASTALALNATATDPLDRQTNVDGEGDCGYSTSAYERAEHAWVNATPEVGAHVARACGASSGDDSAQRHSSIDADARAFQRSAKLSSYGETGYDADGGEHACAAALALHDADSDVSMTLPCVPASILPPESFGLLP